MLSLLKEVEVTIPVGKKLLCGVWTVPDAARGVVLFAHGSGSSRFSTRNRRVAKVLQQAGLGTLLMDMLDETEEEDRANVFDIDLLAHRVTAAVDWTTRQRVANRLPVGLFGASTGAAAALRAATHRPGIVQAVVCRGGRPDLAWDDLPKVAAPTLLIVGEQDHEVLKLNQSALHRLGGVHELRTVPGATHLFEEPGALAEVADAAKEWFLGHLAGHTVKDNPYARIFANREDAACHLAARLKKRPFTDPLVLAIPRGGVVVGAVLAEELHADLDVVLARKLRMPGNPEYALGAIAETGDFYLNIDAEKLPPHLQSYLDQECRHQMAEMERRRNSFGQGRAPRSVTGRSVVVTDDGIATGSTMIAALRALKMQHPRELIVAVPVASPDRLRQVECECDEALCVIETSLLQAVGHFYRDFTPVEDDEVINLLNRFAGRHHEVEH